MRVLFIYPNLYAQIGFNSGLAYISACLKEKGHETKLININEKLSSIPKEQDLINIIRARTFWGRPSGFFFHEGKKYWVRLQIEEARE